jgi:hypothetical protein
MKIWNPLSPRRVTLSISLIALTFFTINCGKNDSAPSVENSSDASLRTPPKIDPSIPVGRPVYTEGPYILGLYQETKDVLELLEKHHVIYWIDGGTLLGAVRSKGIVRWDDDTDICLAPGEEKKFLALESEFKKLGYHFEYSGIVPYHVALNNNPKKIARLDVFTTEEKNGKYFYAKWPWGYRNGKKSYYRKTEVFPLVRYQFGDLQVWGPNSPTNYLIWQYGETWDTEGVQDRTHRSGTDLKKVRFVMTPEDKEPAKPFGPLKNNVN